MLDINIEARPVFTRWQIRCSKCGITFYVDSEPERTKKALLKLGDTKCGFHPDEDSVVMLV